MEREAKKGLKPRAMRAMVLGIPNVGKSTFINRLAKRKATVTGNKPGVTKAQQIIKVDKDFELFDTPGVLWPKFENETVARNIALIGSIKQQILPREDLFMYAVEHLVKNYPRSVENRYQIEIDLLEKILKTLEEGKSARTLEFNEDEQALVKDMFLLTTKPILYVANVSEEQLEDAENDTLVKQVKEYAEKEKAEVIPLCVKIEEELSGLEDEDKKEMLEALGLEESGLDKVIKKSYDLLGLMSFLTAGEPEVRAWTIKKGTKAPQAAGKIHSDIERGFIKAEVVSYDDLIREGSMVSAKEKGLVRSEGKEYIMQDGDIVLFKFNV